MSRRNTGLPCLSSPSGSLVRSFVIAAGQRIGDDERRRGEIIGLRVRAHPAFEIAIAREHRGGDDPVVVDRLGDLVGERAGIADAGRAAEADEIETELVEDPSASRHWRDIRRRPGNPAPATSSPTAWCAAPWPRRCGRAGPRAMRTLGFDVLVQDVIAAITTSPCPRSKLRPSTGKRLAASPGLLYSLASAAAKPVPTDSSDSAALRTFRSGERGHDGRKIEIERLGENRIGRRSGAEEALGLGIFLDQRDARIGAPPTW